MVCGVPNWCVAFFLRLSRMLNTISKWFYKVSNTWIAAGALLIFALFSIFILPGQAEKSEDYSDASGSPDLSFYYTPDFLYDLAESYGEQGRSEYVRARFTFDIIWPLIYFFFLTTAISWVFSRVFKPDSRVRPANLLPLFAILFDLLENISTSLVMYQFPARTPLIAWFAPIFTSTKWLLVAASILALISGCIYGIWKLLSGRFK